MEGDRLTFRISVWRPWLLMVIPLSVLGVGGMVVYAGVDNLGAIASLVLGLAGAELILLLAIGFTVWISAWHVDPNGIGGRNNWLVYHRLDWSEIESVEPWLIPGYRYLQVNGGGRRWAFWLPLFLTDMPGLRSAVTRYAPPDNPLRRYLENHPV